MSPEAWDALRAALAGISTQSAEQLSEYLERIDDGVLSDGDMDHDLLTALESLQAWQLWLATENPEAIADLAVLRLSQIDFEVDACLEDFLAPSEMAEAFKRTVTTLGS